MIVRYADDFVIGFQREAELLAMLSELGERLAVFGLTLHEQKTRLIEFGRIAATSRSQRGLLRPETFALLGFTRYCGWTRARQIHRQAQDREQAPDAQDERRAEDAWRLMHAPLATQNRWYAAVLIGHFGDDGRPQNYRALATFCRPFRREVRRIWFTSLRRRSQKSRKMWWNEFDALTSSFTLPAPRITRPATPRRA